MTGPLMLENQSRTAFSPVTKRPFDLLIAQHSGTEHLTTGILNSIRNNSIKFGKLSKLDVEQTEISTAAVNGISLSGTTTVTGTLIYSLSPTTGNEAVNKLYGINLKNNASAAVTGDLKLRHGDKAYTDYVKCRGQLELKSQYPQLATKLAGNTPTTLTLTRDSRNLTLIGAGEPHRHQFEFNSFEFLRPVESVGTIPIPFIGGALVPVYNYLYHIGGGVPGVVYPQTGSAIKGIYRATILPNGDIGPFTHYGDLPLPLRDMVFGVYKGMIYLLGGVVESNGASLVSSAIYVSSINADGTLSPFTEHAKSFPKGFYGGNAYVTKNRIYAIAGLHYDLTTNGTPFGTECYEVLFDANGSIASVNDVDLLDHTVTGASLSVIGNNVLLCGGRIQYKKTDGNVDHKIVRTAKLATLQPDGKLSRFNTINWLLPESIHYHDSVSTDKYTVLLGGTINLTTEDGVSDKIYFLQHTDSGETLPPRVINLTLPFRMSYHYACIVGDYLYILGGNKKRLAADPNLTIYRYKMVGNRTPVYSFKSFQDGRELLTGTTFQITNEGRDLTTHFALPLLNHVDSGGKFSYYMKT